MTRKGVIHRDLKPENVLFSSKEKGLFEVRVVDFGHAIVLNGRSNKVGNSVGGTLGYLAPEALKYKYFSAKTDIFGIGVILYNMCTLQNLFFGESDDDVLQQNKDFTLD